MMGRKAAKSAENSIELVRLPSRNVTAAMDRRKKKVVLYIVYVLA